MDSDGEAARDARRLPHERRWNILLLRIAVYLTRQKPNR